MPESDEIEMEFGVPIPGRILPREQWVQTAVKRLPLNGPLNWEELFRRQAPVIVDLGCGNGRYTLLSAIARPDCDHAAVDVRPAVIRYATRRGNQRGLSNTRFMVRDAQSFVHEYIPEGSVAEIHLYHPQPYHDPRLAHRRLVTPRFLADVHRALSPGGLFVIQTDNPDYWDYISHITPIFFDFPERLEPWPDAPEGRSRREILSRSRGVRIFRAEAARRDEISRPAALKLASSLPPPRFQTRGPWLELDADGD